MLIKDNGIIKMMRNQDTGQGVVRLPLLLFKKWQENYKEFLHMYFLVFIVAFLAKINMRMALHF